MKIFLMSRYLCATSLGAIALLLGNINLSAQAYPDPTLFYNFDNPAGSIASSEGTESLDLSTYIYDGAQQLDTPSYTAGGGGVSGALTDRALDLSGATGMGGTANFGGGALAQGYLSEIPGFQGAQSITVAGWFYATNSKVNTNAQLVNVSNASYSGFRISGAENGNLQLDYVGENGRHGFSSTNNSYNAVGEWVFFAVTIDTTITSGNNLFFYRVDSEGNLIVDTSARLNDGPFVAEGVRSGAPSETLLTLGNFSNGATNRPFQGFMDNITFWVDDSGSGGALTLEQLDQFRTSLVPEPAFAFLSLGLISLLYVFWKRRLLIRS